MDRSRLPVSAFIDPHGKNRNEIDELFQKALKLVLSYSYNSASSSPLPPLEESSRSVLIDEYPADEDGIFKELEEILKGSMNPSHPGYIGHMDPPPATMSIIGDLAAAALNNNMLCLEMSPTLSLLERDLIKEFAALFGLGAGAGGIMLSGGSLGNIEALAVARNAKFDSLENGITSLAKQPVFFASETAHSSIQKAAMLLGLGTSSVISVGTDNNSRMDVNQLVTLINKANEEGKAPFAVVATAGTTVTGSIDPLPEIAGVANKNELWFHVDAVYGGALMLSRKYSCKLAGIEYADSVTFNPQKWLCITKTSAMVLFRDFSILDRVFRVPAPYMRETGDFINLGEISVQGTRHTDILKLYLSIRHIGRRGYEQLIGEAFHLAEYAIAKIRERPIFELAAEPELNVICFRGVPDWMPEEELDLWNANLQSMLLREGNLFLSLPQYQGKRWLRLVLINPNTDESVIDELFSRIDDYIEAGNLPKG